MNEPRMAALLVAHQRPGFYFRVLQEGEVGAGDDIVKTSDGPEQTSVADIDALLYLPGHSREQLKRALRIPALGKGWQSSFQAMLQQESSSKTAVGNPGLAYEEQAPAWPGFRPMRVANIKKESASVTSFILSPIDGQRLALFQAGQFIVLRLHLDPDKSPVLRSYSLSDLPAADHFRISVKNELNGLGSSFLCNRTREGDVLDISAPRGSFTLPPGRTPVVLLSAGVGATPVMSMLHTLAAERSPRQMVDLWSTQSPRPSICRRIAFIAETALSRTRIHRVQQARCNRPRWHRLRCARIRRHTFAGENWRVTR
jgi:ferredoxin-NADP reductase